MAMEGITLDMTNGPRRVWSTGFNRVSSADGYLYLLRKGYGDVLPDFLQISKEATKDKSKTNGAVKAIVCVQATRFYLDFVT